MKFFIALFYVSLCICCTWLFTENAQAQGLSEFPDRNTETAAIADDIGLDAQILHSQMLSRLPFRSTSEEYYGLFNGAVAQVFRGQEQIHLRGRRDRFQNWVLYYTSSFHDGRAVNIFCRL